MYGPHVRSLTLASKEIGLTLYMVLSPNSYVISIHSKGLLIQSKDPIDGYDSWSRRAYTSDDVILVGCACFVYGIPFTVNRQRIVLVYMGRKAVTKVVTLSCSYIQNKKYRNMLPCPWTFASNVNMSNMQVTFEKFL